MAEQEPQKQESSSTILSPAGSLIEEARKEREAGEKVLEEIKKQKKELEEMHAKIILGGSAKAGSKQEPAKSEDEILEEKAQQMADEAVKRLFGRI